MQVAENIPDDNGLRAAENCIRYQLLAINQVGTHDEQQQQPNIIIKQQTLQPYYRCMKHCISRSRLLYIYATARRHLLLIATARRHLLFSIISYSS